MLHVDHSRHAQSPGSSLPGTRVAAHGKRAAPLLARFLLTEQGAGASGLFSQPRVRHGAPLNMESGYYSRQENISEPHLLATLLTEKACFISYCKKDLLHSWYQRVFSEYKKFLRVCVAQSQCKLPLNLCDAHPQNLFYSEMTL